MSTEETAEETAERLGREGEILRDMFVQLVGQEMPDTSTGAIVNALGTLLVDTILSIDVDPAEQLAEFDRWCAYTRKHLLACQKIVADAPLHHQQLDTRIIKPYDGAQPKRANLDDTIRAMMGAGDGLPATRAEIDGQWCELRCVMVDMKKGPDFIRELHWFPVPRDQLS